MNEIVKQEQICRTCLTDEGHFFDIKEAFNDQTLEQMIQDITNLQMTHLSDKLTRSICWTCVEEVRRAHQFRVKCLESYDFLLQKEIEASKAPSLMLHKIEIPEVEVEVPIIKEELEEICDFTDFLETDISYKVSDGDEDDDEGSDCEDIQDTQDAPMKNQVKDNADTKNESTDTSGIIFDCPLCHGLFTKNNIYQKHINEFHPNKVEDECFKLKREPLGYFSKDETSKRFKKVYKCVLCDFFGNTFSEFKSHIKEHNGEKPIICDECGFRTTDIFLLKKHTIQKHVEEKKFSCSLCNYVCQTRNALKSHFAIHSDERNYKCQICSMTFKQQPALHKHNRTVHEKRILHTCSICQKEFLHSESLKSHMLIHTGGRPFICHHCGKGFKQADNMKTHIKLQHEPIKTFFKCELCNYSTKRASELKNHIKRHAGEKPFKCPHCPYSSVLKYTLKLHIMKHNGEFKFACKYCDFKSLLKNSLIVHESIHTGVKPYPCTICGYSGRTPNILKKHMLIHSSEQFVCSNCPYKTNVKDNLQKHMKRCIRKLEKSCQGSLLKPTFQDNVPDSNIPDSNIPDNISVNDEIKKDAK